MSIAISKKVKFDGARCPFSTFLRLQGDHHCACAQKWCHFHFFQELSNKKIKALRRKMTKIASRGGSCLKLVYLTLSPLHVYSQVILKHECALEKVVGKLNFLFDNWQWRDVTSQIIPSDQEMVNSDHTTCKNAKHAEHLVTGMINTLIGDQEQLVHRKQTHRPFQSSQAYWSRGPLKKLFGIKRKGSQCSLPCASISELNSFTSPPPCRFR